MERSALLALMLCGCATRPHDDGSAGRSATTQASTEAAAQPTSTWVVIDGSRDDAHPLIKQEARIASRKGLIPVLYLSADYSMASHNLMRMRDAPERRKALEGIAVIELNPVSTEEPLLTGYHHIFYSLDANGDPTGRVLNPMTKDGPCADGVVGSCAAWIQAFTMRELALEQGAR